MKNRKIKRLANIILFIVLAIITFSIIFKKNSFSEIISNIKNVNPFFILLAIIAMFIFIACEGINIKRVLKNLECNISYIQSFKYALVGFFFSSVTPSASGGDPAQLYFMTKDKLPISKSTLALLVELSSFQFISCLIAIIGFVYNYDILVNSIGNIKYLLAVGLTINIIIFLVLLIMIFSKKFALKVTNFIIKILIFLHFPKVLEVEEKIKLNIDEYHNCSIYLKNNKGLILKILLTSAIQMILYHSIPYFVYLSFGLNEINFLTFIFMEAVLYISVSSLPFPGAMGVSEGGFMMLFKVFFPVNLLSSAMIISRGISFYLFIIISAFLITVYLVVDKIKLNAN